MNNEWREEKSYVIIDGEFISTENVEFVNIEEDITGRDLMTFIYENQERKSYVINR